MLFSIQGKCKVTAYRENEMDMQVIGLTGQTGGELGKMADVTVRVPEAEMYRIQELHPLVYHCLCMMLEDRFFGS